MRKHKALILAGGLGTRLRPLTFAIPKPLIPVRGRPIIDYILKRLEQYGFNEIYVSLNYQADMIKLYLSERKKRGLKLHYIEEQTPLGTAGPLSFLKNGGLSRQDSVLVMNGDILTNLDLKKLLSVHEAANADITVGMIDFSQTLSYGILLLDKDMNITSVREKPTFKYNASAGIYLVKGKCLELVPRGNYTMPELIRKARDHGLTVKGYRIKEHWLAIEHLKNLEEASGSGKKDWISRL